LFNNKSVAKEQYKKEGKEGKEEKRKRKGRHALPKKAEQQETNFIWRLRK
jgi:hypothetical protein